MESFHKTRLQACLNPAVLSPPELISSRDRDATLHVPDQVGPQLGVRLDNRLIEAIEQSLLNMHSTNF